jgi:pyruvate,water dikinase
MPPSASFTAVGWTSCSWKKKPVNPMKDSPTYNLIDTFCGPAVNDNYITFYFKGGAADIGRRSRRAQMIAQILKQMGFKVEQKGDMVRGEIKKYEERFLVEKVDRLGRLLGSVRLLDMHLADDRQVDWYVEQFMLGNYRFEEKAA